MVGEIFGLGEECCSLYGLLQNLLIYSNTISIKCVVFISRRLCNKFLWLRNLGKLSESLARAVAVVA